MTGCPPVPSYVGLTASSPSPSAAASERSVASRGAPASGDPAPGVQRIVRGVVGDLGERLLAVPRGVLELLAQGRHAAPLPGHLDRREVPLRCAGDSRELDVALLVAGTTRERRHASVVASASDGRIVELHAVSLRRAVAARVAVEAARVREHAGHLSEDRARAPPSTGCPRRSSGRGARRPYRRARRRRGAGRRRRRAPALAQRARMLSSRATLRPRSTSGPTTVRAAVRRRSSRVITCATRGDIA